MSAAGDECVAYVTTTTGSVAGLRLLDIGSVDRFRLDTPDGPVEFAATLEVRLELTTPEGATTVTDAHLPLEDGVAFWPTTCGVTGP